MMTEQSKNNYVEDTVECEVCGEQFIEEDIDIYDGKRMCGECEQKDFK
jgi:formylmethanofuran dehydrogenase subunit E